MRLSSRLFAIAITAFVLCTAAIVPASARVGELTGTPVPQPAPRTN